MMKVNVKEQTSFENSSNLSVEGEKFSKTLTLSNYQLEDGKLESRIQQFVEKFTSYNRSEVNVELGDNL